MEVSQHSRYFCEFCGKRKAVGIWGLFDFDQGTIWCKDMNDATGNQTYLIRLTSLESSISYKKGGRK